MGVSRWELGDGSLEMTMLTSCTIAQIPLLLQPEGTHKWCCGGIPRRCFSQRRIERKGTSRSMRQDKTGHPYRSSARGALGLLSNLDFSSLESIEFGQDFLTVCGGIDIRKCRP